MLSPALALVHPSAHLRDSYRALIAEFVANGDALVPFTLGFANADFDAFLAKLADCANGIGVPILRLSLLRAAERGVSHVLVTCGKQNVASAGAILRNGGVLDSEGFLADRGEVVQRYWIDQ